jgi:hypothetical protein
MKICLSMNCAIDAPHPLALPCACGKRPSRGIVRVSRWGRRRRQSSRKISSEAEPAQALFRQTASAMVERLEEPMPYNGLCSTVPTMGYETQWRDLKFRLRLFWIVALTYVPGVLAMALPLQAYSEDQLIPWLAAGWLVGVMAAGAYLGRYRCPRCGNTFIRSPPPWQPLMALRVHPSWIEGWQQPLKPWNFIELLARRCFYCGLVKGASASGSGSVPRSGVSHEHKA